MICLVFLFTLVATCYGRGLEAEDYATSLFEMYSLVPGDLDIDVDAILVEQNTRTKRAIAYDFIDMMFRHTDSDGNGLISVDEFNNMFQHFDSDHDNAINAREYVSGFKARGYGSQRMGAILFHAGDLNKNGRIETDDLEKVRVRFDINGDHIVTKREYATKWRRILRAVQQMAS